MARSPYGNTLFHLLTFQICHRIINLVRPLEILDHTGSATPGGGRGRRRSEGERGEMRKGERGER